MKTCKFLYGRDNWQELATVPYEQALKIKKAWAQKLQDELMKVPLKQRDIHRIKAVNDAINFNQKLIQELHEGQTT